MRHSRPVIRFSFQAKVLAPVLAFLVLLPTVTLWIINRQISEQALAEARQTLTTADAVFRNSLDILSRGLATRFRGVVNEPRFKAVAQLGDARTMSEFLRESIEEFGAEIEFVTYSVEPGTMLAGARREARVGYDSFLRVTAGLARDAFEGDIGTGTVFADGRTYSVVSVPVPSTDLLSVSGVLTIGLPFGNHALMELKSLTRTEIVVFAGKQVAATTLNLDHISEPVDDRSQDSLRTQSANHVLPIEINGERFLGLSGDYVVAAGRPGFHYLLLSSYEMRLQSLRDTQLTLGAISFVGIFISAGCVWLMIGRVTHPLRALRDSAEAVGRGDFTQKIERFSNDECGELAGTFNQMTKNLLTSRNELEQTVHTLQATDARLRESEEQLRLTIESARDHMICTLDIRGCVQRWNAAAERMLGHTTIEAQGLAYESFFEENDRSAQVPKRLLAMALSTGREAYEGWRVRRDGTRFWAEVTLSRLPEGAGFVEIARDSTLRKQAEETLRSARDTAESANRAKTEFIANMSHELRTPMNSIIGMSSLLLDDPLPEETRDSVQTIRNSADALLEIIDDVLDISKIESGRLSLNQQPYDLCGCIEQIVELCAPRCRERTIELSVHLSRDVPLLVIGDAGRLKQVLSNLVNNAIKFTERGGVTLSVAVDRSDEAEERLLFSISDTGIGIPADHLDRLFKMFSQVDASTTRRFGGMGLGLAIAKRLVELMGGSIGVESKEGRGSRFYFTVRAPSDPVRAVPEFTGLETKRILITGPENIATLGVRQQLATWGALVALAPLDAAQTTDYDLVIRADESNGATACSNEPPSASAIHLVRDVRRVSAEVKPGSLIVPLPVRPRALYSAVRKMLEIARPTRSGPPNAQLYGTEFSQQHPLRILLVEDNAVNSHVAQKMLRRLGYAADWAVDGRKALMKLEEQTYDAVLMDLQMPEMGGLEATSALLSMLPPHRHPYVVAVTANARQDDRDACAAVGMHDFVSKPVQLDRLAGALDRAHAWILARNVEGSPAPLAVG